MQAAESDVSITRMANLAVVMLCRLIIKGGLLVVVSIVVVGSVVQVVLVDPVRAFAAARAVVVAATTVFPLSTSFLTSGIHN